MTKQRRYAQLPEDLYSRALNITSPQQDVRHYGTIWSCISVGLKVYNLLRARNKNILVARPRERSRGKDAGSKGAETCPLWHVEHILRRRRSPASLQLAAAEEIFVTRS